jgi:hypothetical protein
MKKGGVSMENRQLGAGDCPGLDGGARSAEHARRFHGAAKGKTGASNVKNVKNGDIPQNTAKN